MKAMRLSRQKVMRSQHRRAEEHEKGRGRHRELTQGPAARPGPRRRSQERGAVSHLASRGAVPCSHHELLLCLPPHPPGQPLLVLQGLVHKTAPQLKSLSLAWAPSCALRAAGT